MKISIKKFIFLFFVGFYSFCYLMPMGDFQKGRDEQKIKNMDKNRYDELCLEDSFRKLTMQELQEYVVLIQKFETQKK